MNALASPKCTNLMTTIRLEIQEKNKRKYSHNKEQKNMQYYGLVVNKIVAIQRWFRSRLVKRNGKMERKVLEGLRKREWLEKENVRKNGELKEVKERRNGLMREKEGEFLQFLERQIAERVRKAMKGTLDSADRLAENKAKVRYILGQIDQTQSKKQELQGQIQALKFQFACHRKRKAEWQEKLFKIKESILNETLKTKDLKTRISQITKKQEEQMRKPSQP